MSWSFAIINGKLGEIYFEKTKNGQTKFLGHCYIAEGECITKQEQKCIDADTKKSRIVYRNKKYKVIQNRILPKSL